MVSILVMIIVVAILIGFPVGCGFWAKTIAEKKHLNPGGYFALGFFLGLLGVIIASVASPGPPGPPSGLHSVICPRCNAVQNVMPGAAQFECWQCRTPTRLGV
jgi:hypothetical protein